MQVTLTIISHQKREKVGTNIILFNSVYLSKENILGCVTVEIHDVLTPMIPHVFCFY